MFSTLARWVLPVCIVRTGSPPTQRQLGSGSRCLVFGEPDELKYVERSSERDDLPIRSLVTTCFSGNTRDRRSPGYIPPLLPPPLVGCRSLYFITPDYMAALIFAVTLDG
jgi:hypothetical protein